MGTFSTKMRTVAFNLIAKLGNSCTLEKVTTGGYNATTGKSEQSIRSIATHSAPAKNISVMFGQDGTNTNLAGFDEGKVTVAYLGVNENIDETWLYNGEAITHVEPIESQDEVVVFNLTVASS